ncbi:phosphotransferase [Shouchella sp. JSM 1781072]|uniref:phosphotransferase n=1 Tax=Shouchella sp. JSM 1781072 TaxID=3344581 RepID=UPI0035BF2833
MISNEEKEKKVEKVMAYSAYLAAGSYQFSTDFRIFFHESKQHHPICRNVEGTTEVWNIADEQKQFAGKILWFSSSGDIRIFSNTEVLTLCANKENYLRKIENNEHFSYDFQLPKQLFKDDINLIIKEEAIPFVPNDQQDDAFILKTLFRDYKNYFCSVIESSQFTKQSMSQLLQTSSNTVHRHDFETIINNIYPSLLDEAFPFVKLHGDLWSENLLVEKNKDKRVLWYIDWDESGEYLFFYDFYRFIWNELDVHQNHSYYDQYMDGAYDDCLKDLFGLFNLVYKPELKQSYFYLFFLNLLLDETGTMTYEVKQFELNDFLRKIGGQEA